MNTKDNQTLREAALEYLGNLEGKQAEMLESLFEDKRFCSRIRDWTAESLDKKRPCFDDEIRTYALRYCGDDRRRFYIVIHDFVAY